MWTELVNWLQVNIQSHPQIFKGIIALIIMLIAFFLFPTKSTGHSLYKDRRVWSIFLFVLGIFAFLYAFIADIADVFTVLATIVLAGVAVFSFEENRRLRKQYQEREERDRRERLLNEITEWAITITNWRPRGSAKEMLSIPVDLQRRQLFSEVVGAIEIFVAFRGRNQYAKRISRIFGGDLEELVNKLIDTLEKNIEFLLDWRNMISSTIAQEKKKLEEKDASYIKNAADFEGQIELLAFQVIEEAAKLKTQDIG